MRHIHTTEYYSAINRRGALIHTTIWMNPENTMLVKKARHKGHMLCNSIHMKHPEKADPQNRPVTARALGRVENGE